MFDKNEIIEIIEKRSHYSDMFITNGISKYKATLETPLMEFRIKSNEIAKSLSAELAKKLKDLVEDYGQMQYSKGLDSGYEEGSEQC